MTGSRDDLRSPGDHRAALEALERLAAGDPAARTLLEGVLRVLRYEMGGAVPAGESLLARLSPREAPAVRTALISDIHGNLGGLLAVIADIEACGCDRILCLGDLVDGGGGDEEVVELLRRRAVRSVRGNHDEHNDVPLRDETRRFLAALPESIVEDDVVYAHISPRARKRKVDHAVEAWNVFQDVGARLVFVGHAHRPLAFAERCVRYGEAACVAFEYNRPWRLDPADRYVVCVGSVGYGRDELGKPRYAIHDRAAGTIEFRAVDGPVLSMDYSLRVRAEGPLELLPKESGT